MKRRLFLAAALAAAVVPATRAETVAAYGDEDVIDPDDVMRILAPDAAAPTGLTRSIRNLVQGTSATPPQPAAPRADALSIPIRFGFDSSELATPACRQLDAIAEGIRRLPATRRVTIEGHTDAVGSDDYNYALSLRRATAVKSYLVNSQGIDPARLKDVGYGKLRPLAGSDPQAAANRRVQFRGG
ncbi:MAG TPA: OmpA family protein [Burkholderiaceae bacterium]|nr:OmpA family protein [Burkholderiaceae bacterium]